MTPKEYLDRYTYLEFPNPFTGFAVSAGISNYGSGWNYRNGVEGAGGAMQTEYQRFVAALRMTHHGNRSTPCGVPFFFADPQIGLIAPTEEFYPETLTHAFDGKGSPDEIIDTLRLAVAIGRVGTGPDAAGQPPARPTAQAYATDFMTLDCNGLVGNYFGGDPSSSISAYASPTRRRQSVWQVRSGDAVVTHCPEAQYEHVGLIDQWYPISDDSAQVRVAEWGWYGGESVHYTAPLSVAVSQGPVSSLGVGWATTSNSSKWKNKPTFRYIFSPPSGNDPWGWS